MPFITYELETFPGRTLSLCYYSRVTNAGAIRQQILQEAPAYAVVNAQLIVDEFQVSHGFNVELAGVRACKFKCAIRY